MSADGRCTIKQLAEIIGVAPSTVSRVLNKRPSNVKITEATCQKIRAAAKKHGYEPNINAKRLLNNKSFVIGLEVPVRTEYKHTFADNTLIETMSGIEDVIAGGPYKLMCLFRNEKYMNDAENVKLLRERSIDGLLVWGSLYTDSFAKEITNYPAIFLNTRPQGLKNLNYIGHDNFGAAFEIAERAIAAGGRQFLCFSTSIGSSIGEERFNGFMAAMSKHKIRLARERIVQAEFRRDLAAKAMDKILTEKKTPVRHSNMRKR